MSEPKKKKPTKKPDPPQESADSTIEAEEITPTVLGSEDWVLVQKVSTLLFHIPAYAARAKLHGYTDEEHELGKSLVAVV